MREMAGYGLAAGYLILCSLEDIRKKSVPVFLLLFGMAGGVAFRGMLFLMGDSSLGEMLACLIPGALLWLFAVVSREIGDGDGIAWIGIGGFLGGAVYAVLLVSLILAFFWSAGILIRKAGGRKYRIPFLPFSLAGLVLWLAVYILETR